MNRTKSNNFHLFSGVPWMIVYVCEAVLILAGNSVTIYIFWNIRKRLKRTSYLLINLAVADILVGIALVFWLWDGIAAMTGISVSYNVFKTAFIIDLIGILSSILALALISLERMFAILWPFRHRMLSTCHYHFAIGSVWLLSSLNVVVNVNIESAYSLLTVIIVIASVVIISGAYLAIWISTKRNQFPNNTSRAMEQNRKLAKTLFVVTAMSITTCLPNGINLAFRDYLMHLHSFRVQISMVTQYANSFLNPVVHCFKMPEFKKSLKKLLCRCSRQNLSFNENSSGTSNKITLKSIKVVKTS